MIKRATVTTWAEYFEKREGVRISEGAIRKRLKEAGKIGESARNRVGRLLNGAYFSELDVRAACKDLLRPMPQADENGFLVLAGIRHGTVYAWACDLRISRGVVAFRLCISNIMPVEGKDSQGKIQDFFPEPAVRETLSSLLLPILQADENGFFVQGGIRYGTIGAWARELEVSANTVFPRLRSAGVAPVEGKAVGGQIRDFYAEVSVRFVCADLLKDMPQADESGFFGFGGIRHGTIGAWTRKLGISALAIVNRLRSAPIPTIEGKDSQGKVQDFYPEPAVCSACADLLLPMPQGDATGFLVLGGVRHGIPKAWARDLGLSYNAVQSRLRFAGIAPVAGKASGGQVCDFFSEPAVREACAVLLKTMPHADKTGFFELGGIRHGTARAWSRALGVYQNAILTHLRSANAPFVEGKDSSGQIQAFYTESDVRSACANLLLPMPHADKTGFFELGGVRHGTAKAWSRALGISDPTIASRLRAVNVQPVKGRDSGGNVWAFYPEPAVREACKDLIEKKEQKDVSPQSANDNRQSDL